MPLHCFFVDINKTKKNKFHCPWSCRPDLTAIGFGRCHLKRGNRKEATRPERNGSEVEAFFFFFFFGWNSSRRRFLFMLQVVVGFFFVCFLWAVKCPSRSTVWLRQMQGDWGPLFFFVFLLFLFFLGGGGGLRSVLFSSSISAKAELIDWANRWMRPQTHLPAVIASSECFTGFRRSSYRVFFVAALSFVALRRRSSDWLVPMRPQSHLPDRRLPVDGAGVGDYEPFFYILAIISDERRWASMRAPSSTINSHTSWRRGGHQSSMGYNRGHSFDSTLKLSKPFWFLFPMVSFVRLGQLGGQKCDRLPLGNGLVAGASSNGQSSYHQQNVNSNYWRTFFPIERNSHLSIDFLHQAMLSITLF